MIKMQLGFTLLLSLFSLNVHAGSGEFCSPSNERIEYNCDGRPYGPGWVAQPDGCFQRATGQSCGGYGGIDNGRGDYGRPGDVRGPRDGRGGGGRRPPMPPPYRPEPSYPGLTCRADDAGWEEHSSHFSCHECLREHGRCIETCSEISYTCEVEGRDYRGMVVKYSATANDTRRAEWEAQRSCQQYASRCSSYAACKTNERVVSRRECR